MNNMPELKIGVVAVSRDCFPESLSVTRREALMKAYIDRYGDAQIYECPICIVESEIHICLLYTSIATSLSIEMGKTFSREKLIGEIVRELDKMWYEVERLQTEYLETYRKACITIGKEVQVIAGEAKRRAKAVQVNEDYSLEVEYEDGSRESLNSGEVSVRGMEGYVS